MNDYLDFRAVAEQHLNATPNVNLYFLFDHAGIPGLVNKLPRTSTEWVSLFDDTKESSALAVAPILVTIVGNGRIKIPKLLFEWISEHGTFTSTVLMLASTLDVIPLKNRLARRLHIRLSESMDAMLRFFDPRVFEQIIKILNDEQSHVFFSPASKWWYVNQAGKIGFISTEFDPEEKFRAPLLLSEEQEFQFLDASEPDRVLALLRENAPNLISLIPSQNQYEYVANHMAAAKGIGLYSTADFVLYCAAVLSYGEDFASSRILSAVLHDVKQNGRSFSVAVGMIDLTAEVVT